MRRFFGALGHAPTVANLVNDVAAVKAGTLTLAQEASALTLSTEFVSAYGALTGADFANQLYPNLLARPANTNEQTYQLKVIGQIDHGIAASDAHFP